MNQEQHTTFARPSEADPLLEQVFTPTISIDKGFSLIVSERIANADYHVYVRKPVGSNAHYVVTRLHLVICLTLSFDVAVFVASRKSKRVKP